MLLALSARATPNGISPYIYGMHDTPDPSLLDGPDGCARGWVTELRYIGASGVCEAGDIDMSHLSDAGYGIIMRLDAWGSPPLPTDAGQYDGFAAAFADCVARSNGVRVWVVGNEPNIAWGHIYAPSEYGEIYRRVLNAVKALPDGQEHEVLVAAMAPWASVDPWGDWDDGLAAAIDYVRNNGGYIDGVAIHAYTREFSTAAITSDAWFPSREGKWHLHFRGYRDTTALLLARGITDIPLYITESGNACDPPCDPYPDQDIGYFVAMYEEIHGWNQLNPSQVIRAVTPYRWTQNDDGSGRDFCIGCSAPLVSDMENAIAMDRRWHQSSCNETTPDAGVDGGVLPDGSTNTDSAVPADSASPPDGQGQDVSVLEDGGAQPDASPQKPGSFQSGCGCRVTGRAGRGASGFVSLLLMVLMALVAIRTSRKG